MVSRLLARLARVAWFLPGFLLWASFPPMGERMDCLFALAPLLWLSRNETDVRICVRRWFLNGIFFWVATLAWMPAIVKNGGPWPLVVLGWGALAAYCAAYFALFGWLTSRYWRWLRRRCLFATEVGKRQPSYLWRLAGILVVEPVLWAGLELVRSRFLGGFAWNQLGVAMVNGGFAELTSLGGVYLASAAVILVNGTVAGIAERFLASVFAAHPNWPRRFGASVGAQSVPPALRTLETVLPFAMLAGLHMLACDWGVRPAERTEEVRVALVQRNFPCVFKGQAEHPLAAYDRLLGSVAELRPDLVVLPESAMSEFGAIDGDNAGRFARWLSEKTGGAALLAGGSRTAGGRIYNSAALYAPLAGTNAFSRQIYDKVHLVPFGEFIPGDKWIPALQQLAPVGSCTPGELKLLPFSTSTSSLNLGVAICYEDTDSVQIRELARKGARLLAFITNDSWFSQSDEAEQHAWQAVARAVETGLPVVRVGNNGVSGVITPDGRASWLLDAEGRPAVDTAATLLDRVAVPVADGGLTPYVRFGDVPLMLVFMLLILGMILVKYLDYEKRRRMSV